MHKQVSPFIQLYQAEWCPYSQKVRQKLTELGLPFLAWQVPAASEERNAMRRAVGIDEIPVLILPDGEILAGEAEDIIQALDERYPPRPDASLHRAKWHEHREHSYA